jgi:type I restriction enzyme S subunit
MKLEQFQFPKEWKLGRVAESFDFTSKPRGLDLSRNGDEVPFFPMDQIPLGRIHVSDFTPKPLPEIGSGTYVENGDLMVAKITPSFENGKQAIVDIASDFAYATTEVIPMRGKKGESDTLFLFFYLLHPEVRSDLAGKMEGSTGRQRLSKTVLGDRLIPLPPLPEQKKIAHILSTVQRAIEAQERIIATTTELKKALMHKLFTEGLRHEPQKQTEIGPVPESWATPTVESVCTIKASAMSYSQLEKAPNDSDGVRVIGIKVSDMNLPGNEIEFRSANLERLLSEETARKRTVPADSIIFPKRGAAIATNKKRLTTGYTVLDPNLIAVMPSEAVSHRYLFHWFNTFDLKTITDPGPTPQLNKKDIAPLKFPMPPIEEQQAIAGAIDAAEEKATLHIRKRDQLQDLFRTLLHELMTAKTRVHELELSA